MNTKRSILANFLALSIGVSAGIGSMLLLGSLGIDFSVDEESYPHSIMGGYSFWIILFIVVVVAYMVSQAIYSDKDKKEDIKKEILKDK